MATLTKLEVVAKHILNLLPHSSQRPLIIGLQGPQGSGKTYLSAQLRDYLTSSPHHLRTVLLSIDDLYLPHDKLVELAASQPPNPLWQGRGQPGTHDVELGLTVLSALKQGSHNVELPRFDKSLHDGQGDRLPLDGSGVVVEQPPCVDVVIFEGWFINFHSVDAVMLDEIWNGMWQEEQKKLGLSEDTFCSKRDVQRINEALLPYEQLWEYLDTFVQIMPSPPESKDSLSSKYSIVYKWRLEQEHYMKARNGGRGMSDEAVKRFVDRYIPGYVFFGAIPPPVSSIDPPRWMGQSLRVLIDEQRKFLTAIKL